MRRLVASLVGGSAAAAALTVGPFGGSAQAQEINCPLTVRIDSFVWNRDLLLAHLGEPNDLTGRPLTLDDLRYMFDNARLIFVDADGNIVEEVDPVAGEGYVVPAGGVVRKCWYGSPPGETTTTTPTPNTFVVTVPTTATPTTVPGESTTTVPPEQQREESTTTASSQTLPSTGNDSASGPMVAGLAGLGAGALLLAAGRRRRSSAA